MSETRIDPAAMWDERYARESFAYGETANAFLKSQRARLKAGMRALVPGDGEGRNGVWLAEQGLIVDTLDLSQHGVAKARRLAQARGVALNAVQADALRLGVAAPGLRPRRADLFASRRRRAARAARQGSQRFEARRARHPRSVPARAAHASGRRRARRPARAELLYAVDDLMADFAALDVIELTEADADFDEGALHVGASAVIRAVARRP